jgi:CRISPR/Cas system-associated endonuclease Cas1
MINPIPEIRLSDIFCIIFMPLTLLNSEVRSLLQPNGILVSSAAKNRGDVINFMPIYCGHSGLTILAIITQLVHQEKNNL